MDLNFLHKEIDLKPDFDPVKPICRCCLSTDRRMSSATVYDGYFRELAGITVLESDGLPQWLCWECRMLLQNAVRFKHKMLRAHNILYEYLTRCAPFPIDAQDPELSKYAMPHLCATDTQVIDNSKSKMGYHSVLEHEKIRDTKVEIPVLPLMVNKIEEESLKDEICFPDYEDNITLDEFRSNVEMTEDDLAKILQDSENIDLKEHELLVKKKRKTKKKEVKVKKKKKATEDEPEQSAEQSEAKTSIRKAVELDPEKIRVVMLDPEEQVKLREEESKSGLKFPFQCHLCYKGFNFEAKLQNHMAKHSPSRGPFECKLCHTFLPTSYSFSVHMVIHTRRYECVKCGRRMIDRASIVEHYKTQHEGLLTLFTCHICGKVSSNSKTHKGHMRNHHSGDRPKCDQCGKNFLNKDSLAEHMQIHQGIKNYQCDLCSMKCRTRTQMKQHQLKHTDAREYYCVECDVRFKSACSLKQHLQKSLKHKDKNSFKHSCSECGRRYESVSALARHRRVQHLGERPHACAVCGARLASRPALRKHHLHVHDQRRPLPKHVCHHCGKAFRGKSVLVNHVRTHTGEKPYSCGECARRFTQRTAMRTHYRLVHLKIKNKSTCRGTKSEPVRVTSEPWTF